MTRKKNKLLALIFISCLLLYSCMSAPTKSSNQDIEMLIHIKDQVGEGEFRIKVKDWSNFTRSDKPAFVRYQVTSYGKACLRKCISQILQRQGEEVIMKKTFLTKDKSRTLYSKTSKGKDKYGTKPDYQETDVYRDRLLIVKYKDPSHGPHGRAIWQYLPTLEIMMRQAGEDMNRQFCDVFSFSYLELSDAIDDLIKKDQLVLNGAIITVKKRTYKDFSYKEFTLQYLMEMILKDVGNVEDGIWRPVD